jgi:glycosyltransferase involved in cell wall biosynthesis
MTVVGWPYTKGSAFNPYIKLLYGGIQKAGLTVTDLRPGRLHRLKGDRVLHLHWPDYHFARAHWAVASVRSCLYLLVCAYASALGFRLVWTTHNLEPHRNPHPRTFALFQRIFLSLLDGAIALTQAAADLAQTRLPGLVGLPMAVIPHGHYRGCYPDETTRAAARELLGVPPGARVALFVGGLHAYKNVGALVEAFCRMEDAHAMLVIAGAPATEAMAAEAARWPQRHPGIRTLVRYLPDEELQYLFRAADLCVLPFANILNSGSLFLSLSFDTPVLVPALGSMPEHSRDLGPQWVRLYQGALTPALLEEALDQGRAMKTAGARAPLDAYGWDRIGQQHAAFFTSLFAPEAIRP